MSAHAYLLSIRTAAVSNVIKCSEAARPFLPYPPLCHLTVCAYNGVAVFASSAVYRRLIGGAVRASTALGDMPRLEPEPAPVRTRPRIQRGFTFDQTRGLHSWVQMKSWPFVRVPFDSAPFLNVPALWRAIL